MNQFFYETRGKEIVKSLMEEGQRSQAIQRSKGAKAGLIFTLPKLAVTLLGILVLLGLLIR